MLNNLQCGGAHLGAKSFGPFCVSISTDPTASHTKCENGKLHEMQCHQSMCLDPGAVGWDNFEGMLMWNWRAGTGFDLAGNIQKFNISKGEH